MSQISSCPPSSIEELQRLISTHPVIDNHAHNLLRSTDNQPLESITSEASGLSLSDVPHTLSHIRAVKQLSSLLGCEDDWNAVKKARSEADPEVWAKRCLEGTQCILMDDGLEENDKVFEYTWHDKYSSSPTKRIVRIERLAEKALEKVVPGYNFEFSGSASDPETSQVESCLEAWKGKFLEEIEAAIHDTEVVGFKSVVCYRTGLDISATSASNPLFDGFLELLKNSAAGPSSSYRINNKVVNDWIVHSTAKIMSQSPDIKPLQFHTGLGDNDINLVKSNPAYLQSFIESYPNTPIVLLHSSYPFTREAGYLATVYSNVYLDFGLAFPTLSKDGQKSIIKQMLELTPTNKLLWSTDGHLFPETYALANIQMRETLAEVLTKRVTRSQISLAQAAEIVKNLLFENSNRLYRLNLTAIFASSPSLQVGTGHPASTILGTHPLVEFIAKYPMTKYFRLQWLDYTSTLRLRVIPVSNMKKMVEKNRFLKVTRAGLSLVQDDSPTDDFSPVGHYVLSPDWTSLRSCEGYAPGHASVMCFFRDGKNGEQEVDVCPRTVTSRIIQKAKSDHKVDFLVGFETEVVFLQAGSTGHDHPKLVSEIHAWSTAYALQNKCLRVLEEITKSLSAAGIEVLQFHPESNGQFEIVTGPLPPLESIDALIHTRETISTICANHHIRATLHPKPWTNGVGTSAHTHISISPSKNNEEHFFAGVLEHLRAVVAFTMPMAVSYDRLVDGYWAGGVWIAWGEQNREVPLRLVDKEKGHYELRCVDGTANMYLGIAAILAAGCLGLTSKAKLPGKGCNVDPSKLTSTERNRLGVTGQLPGKLEDSLEALKADKKLKHCLGEKVVEKFVGIKKAEKTLLDGLPGETRRGWIMDRY